jgi:hypothetical protein
MERRSFDSSHRTAHADAAYKEHKRSDDKVGRLDAASVRLFPLNPVGRSLPATRSAAAGRRQSGFWIAMLECFIEGLALYGASIHPTGYFGVQDCLPRSATRQKRQEAAFGDSPADDASLRDDKSLW